MAKWRDLSDASAVPARTRRWMTLLNQDPPVTAKHNPRHRKHKQPKAVEIIKGQYAPIWMACPNCGQVMIRQLDMWNCYCGQTIAHQSGNRYQIVEADENAAN